MGVSPEIGAEQIKEASGRLVSAVVDLQDSLSLKLENKLKSGDPEVVAVCYASEALTAFADSAYVLQAASPRSIRDKDRPNILPGQHSGVYLQFGIPKEGTILIVNFKGGLRILSSIDLQDRDVSGLKRSHTRTTDKVLEQPIEINWQLNLPGGGPKIDCWVVLNQQSGKFRLSNLKIDNKRIDAHPEIQKSDKYFDSMRNNLSTAMRDLTSFIPSSS